VDKTIDKLEEDLGHSITKVYRRDCSVRPDDLKDFNHFGWRDGFTRPFVRYYDDNDVQRFPGPGEPIIRYPSALVIRDGDRPNLKWAINGSLVAFRHFHMLVPEFDDYLNSIAIQPIFRSHVLAPNSTDTDSEIRKRAEFIGARFNGRWKSGAPLVLAPYKDDKDLGRDPDRRNNFRDYPRNQSYCPFAAHIRKSGPRSDLLDELDEHVIVRGGLPYGKELTEHEKTTGKTVEDRGLAFACYQSSLVNGFEFVQKRCNNLESPVSGTKSGLDPIIGQGDRRMTGYDVEDLEKELTGIPLFSIVYGGGYFFLPSLSTLKQIK
jgi:Dyp-type peroxidase family